MIFSNSCIGLRREREREMCGDVLGCRLVQRRIELPEDAVAMRQPVNNELAECLGNAKLSAKQC